MKILLALAVLFSQALLAQSFSCPEGEADVMKYFVLSQQYRSTQFMKGSPNSIYTEVFPDQDFAEKGYWFWLKSAAGNGFDVKAYDGDYVYMRSTELIWTDKTTFKRFLRDLPIAARCVPEGKPGPEIKVENTAYQYYSSCKPYKQSQVGTAVLDLDAPVQMQTEGNIAQVWTRVLHYHYNCNQEFQACQDEEQFFLANGYGEWQWKHFKNGVLVNATLINDLQPGTADGSLPCTDSYRTLKDGEVGQRP